MLSGGKSGLHKYSYKPFYAIPFILEMLSFPCNKYYFYTKCIQTNIHLFYMQVRKKGNTEVRINGGG